MSLSHSALLVAAMSLVTILLRALPFLVFRKNTPDWLAYLGKVLVVYCLKDTKISSAPFGVPELISALLVVALQAWKRNVLVSILAGTICYMALIHFVF